MAIASAKIKDKKKKTPEETSIVFSVNTSDGMKIRRTSDIYLY